MTIAPVMARGKLRPLLHVASSAGVLRAFYGADPRHGIARLVGLGHNENLRWTALDVTDPRQKQFERAINES
ncbi:MAG TPA: hypothetical protein VME66_15280 [Candidatus Acidoferrales bacterium]|nr:hypothetical protein [Candidatus Acidoferrales bacterium]